jgi:hypothetical protein
MPLTADAIERDTIIAYQLFMYGTDSWQYPAALTIVPEDGKGLVEADGGGFEIDSQKLEEVTPNDTGYISATTKRDATGEYRAAQTSADVFLIVRWNMSGPLDYAIQRDDSEEVLERLPFILNRKNAYQEMPESRYGDLGRLRWVMDRAITFGNWRKF